MPTRTRYSDEDRAACLAALAANGGNVGKTAREVGVPYSTLQQWARGLRHPEAMQMSEDKKEDLGDAFEALARKLVVVASKKAEQLDARDASIAAGVAVDKMRLLRGESTAIEEVRQRVTEEVVGDEDGGDPGSATPDAAGIPPE